MFAAKVRASLKPLFHGRQSSSLCRNRETEVVSRRFLHARFSDGDRSLISLRLSGYGMRIKHFYRAFHSSQQCYSSESDAGVKTRTPALFTSLEDEFFSELGSVVKVRNRNMVVKLLTKMPEHFQVEKHELSQKTKSRKKKHEQASDLVFKPKLLTEKPEISGKIIGERKMETRASLPAINVMNSNVSLSKRSKSSSPIRYHESTAQNIISPCSKAKNETSSKGSSTSITPLNHRSSAVFVRIGNLNPKTADSMIHSMCLSIGPHEGLSRVNEDTVDVVSSENLNEADSILGKLNDATVDHSQWTAEIVPEETCRYQMGMKISSCFEDLKKQEMMRQILAKDLEVLLHSVTHLENHPVARVGTKALGSSHEA